MERLSRYIEIFLIATRLGLTSFGGPVAHLAYFQEEYVQRRKWLSDQMYADLIALCQFLPGPASSQVGISIGMLRGGLVGGLLAWIGFTLPSVLILTIFAWYVIQLDLADAVWIGALKVVAVAVVAHAVLNMGKKLAPDLPRIALLVGSATVLLLFPFATTQLIVIALAAIIGALYFKNIAKPNEAEAVMTFSKKIGAFSLSIFVGLLTLLPILNHYYNHIYIELFDIFYRVGSIVFGGGHVVLPLLERELVPSGLISEDMFLAGYGAAQAIPGPLFTFSSYLGTIIHGIPGMLVATIAIFLPSFLLIIGILPFWQQLRQMKYVGAALLGVNAAVVGIIVAAFYHPIFTSGIMSELDFAVALLGFSLLQFWKRPAWLVVIIVVVVYILLSLLM
ncbi:chromate transporter [Alkalibacillus filiformis]|uniref:Chromate transporter n=1 Tax=Alkalibacillus filiformis TaxID=200990 RepID=A0ABU0DT75_9BACI|nr:chromate efflux transporter [Alkalibacillus filiformis]MDQ0351646.1 chromate transporter [Alkalibacillus filiformis]